MPVRRSILTTPGSDETMMAKAAESSADEVTLDLEDSVAPGEKAAARDHVTEALHEHDWTDKTVGVRTNDLDYPGTYKDLIQIVEGANEHLDVVVVPKVTRAADVYVVETLLDQIERETGVPEPLGIEVLIEETKGLQRVDEIAAASDRLEALIFGPGDLSASQGVDLNQLDAEGVDGFGADIWHYARNRIAVAARANEVDPIDGPYADFSDMAGFRRECVKSRAMGFVGKWTIHPAQIETANEVFAPTRDAIERARGVIEAMERAKREGRGAVEFDGAMLDEVSIRRAERTLERAAEVGLLDDE